MPISQQNKVILTQMKIANDAAYLHVTPDAARVPVAVSNLLKLPDAAALRAALIRLSDTVSDVNLSNPSTLLKDKGFYKLHNWASGGSLFRRFKDDTITDFFEELFTVLAAVSLSLTSGDKWWAGNPVQITRADLFHGHLVWDTSADLADILFLFHAKEYPSDIEETKSANAKLLDPDHYEDFKTSSAGFKYRCSIYSLRLNRLHILKLSDNASPYKSLVADPNLNGHQNPLRIDQDDLGECVSDVNYFPNDGVRLFFCTRPRSE